MRAEEEIEALEKGVRSLYCLALLLCSLAYV